jgi:hypothetical protein
VRIHQSAWIRAIDNQYALVDGAEYDLPVTQAPAAGEPPASSVEDAVAALRRALNRSWTRH